MIGGFALGLVVGIMVSFVYIVYGNWRGETSKDLTCKLFAIVALTNTASYIMTGSCGFGVGFLVSAALIATQALPRNDITDKVARFRFGGVSVDDVLPNAG